MCSRETRRRVFRFQKFVARGYRRHRYRSRGSPKSILRRILTSPRAPTWYSGFRDTFEWRGDTSSECVTRGSRGSARRVIRSAPRNCAHAEGSLFKRALTAVRHVILKHSEKLLATILASRRGAEKFARACLPKPRNARKVGRATAFDMFF